MLSSKQMLPEWMDHNDIAAQDYDGAMTALGTLNAWSRTAQMLSRYVCRMIRNSSLSSHGHSLMIHDYGCGDGELTVRLSRRLVARGIAHRLVGFDANARGIERGRARFCKGNDLPVELHATDVLSLDTPCDIAISSLFMHHLTDFDLGRLLQQAHSRVSCGLIFSDLRRCYCGLALAYLATRCLTKSDVARNDGPISVRNSRTRTEMKFLASQAGLDNAQVYRHWPTRLVLHWQAPSPRPIARQV